MVSWWSHPLPDAHNTNPSSCKVRTYLLNRFLLGWNFFRTICPGCQRSTGHLQFLQENLSWLPEINRTFAISLGQFFPGCQRSTGHLQFLQDNQSWTINWNFKVRLIVVKKHSTLMAKSGNVLHKQFIVNTTNVMSRGFDHQLPLLLIWINFNPIVDK